MRWHEYWEVNRFLIGCGAAEYTVKVVFSIPRGTAHGGQTGGVR